MPIIPDEKNWTWVLEQPCPECGLDAAALDLGKIGLMIRDNASMWNVLLGNDAVRRRPSDDRWSALEYGCHVRDVLRLYEYRLALMLENDDPLFPNWDQDETAVAERYDRQDPAVVASEIVVAADALADRFETVGGDQWTRRGRRSDGVAFTIDSFARYFIHDPMHHVADVRAGYASMAE